MTESLAFRQGLPTNFFSLPNGTNSSTVSLKKTIMKLLDTIGKRVDIKMSVQGYSWDFIVSRLPPPSDSDEEVNTPTGESI